MRGLERARQNKEGSVSTPTPVSERLAVVDVLRAFSLLGIILTHAAGSYLAGPPPAPDYNIFTGADRLVVTATQLLLVGKFFSIFAFLFGLSFAIQLDSAARNGRSFGGRFAWRLTLLLAIGFVHGLFYGGDILIIYAVLGFLLIPLHRVKSGALLVVALLLVTNLPGLVINVAKVSAPPPAPEQRAAAAQAGAAARERFLRAYEIKRSGGVAELVRMNAAEGLSTKLGFQVRSGRLWMTFGLFLLGVCAGRLNLFRDTAGNRAFFRRLGTWTGAVALVTTALAIAFPRAPMAMNSYRDVLVNFSFNLQQMSLAAFYTSMVALLFWWRPDRGVLPALAPMGKMGLTTYLTQSVFGLCLFYGVGLGLMGKLGVAPAVLLGAAFFVVQVLLAQWWLRRFSMGPVEWLWRTLTWFKPQPLVRKAFGTA